MNNYDRIRKREAVNQAEAEGAIADSMDVRLGLIKRMSTGEITLAQGQAELKKIKRNASKTGKTTRSRAWSQG